jgi:hypothetical protein
MILVNDDTHELDFCQLFLMSLNNNRLESDGLREGIIQWCDEFHRSLLGDWP